MLVSIASRIRDRVPSGVAAFLGFAQRLTGTQPGASRAADARRATTHHQDQAAFVERGRDTKRELQERADSGPPLTTND